MTVWFADQGHLWLAFGLLGQALFSARFVVQWLASERAQTSVVPMLFWYFSLAGGITLLIYAIARHDPVFILGQGMGIFIYARNIMLLLGRSATRESQGGEATPVVKNRA